MKKILSLILILSFVFTLVACAGGDNNVTKDVTKEVTKTAETAEPSQTEPSNPLRRDADDGITETFGNKQVNIVLDDNKHTRDDLVREDLIKEVLNDAIYARKNIVEDRLKVKIKFVDSEDSIDVSTIQILSGLDTYQIIAGDAISTYAAASNGYYINYNGDRNKYVNIDQPWWNSYIADTSTLYGKLYCVTGDLSLSLIKKCFAIFFNKAALANFSTKMSQEQLFDLVESGIDSYGGWTYDKFLDLIKGTSDGDFYGLIMDNSRSIDPFWSAFDINLLVRTNDGGVAWAEDLTKIKRAADDLLDKLLFVNPDVNVLHCDRDEERTGISSTGDEIAIEFGEGRALLAILTFANTDNKQVRNMSKSADDDDGYGIIPMPKYDDYQTTYYSYVEDSYCVYAIPKTIKNADAATATLEALASHSYSVVNPIYYDDILNGKYMNDERSTQMIDLITANIKLDYLWIHTFAFPSTCPKPAQHCFRETINNFGKKTFEMYWSAYKRPLDRALTNSSGEGLLDKYKALT